MIQWGLVYSSSKRQCNQEKEENELQDTLLNEKKSEYRAVGIIDGFKGMFAIHN